MFLLKTLRPAPQLLDPARFLCRAVDASIDEPARVAAIRHLHAVARPDFEPLGVLGPGPRRAAFLADALVALTPILSEPLTWLPLEALSLLVLLGTRAMFGVQHGRFVLSPSRPGGFVVDTSTRAIFCPVVGRVVSPRRLHELAYLVDRRRAWL